MYNKILDKMFDKMKIILNIILLLITITATAEKDTTITGTKNSEKEIQKQIQLKRKSAYRKVKQGINDSLEANRKQYEKLYLENKFGKNTPEYFDEKEKFNNAFKGYSDNQRSVAYFLIITEGDKGLEKFKTWLKNDKFDDESYELWKSRCKNLFCKDPENRKLYKVDHYLGGQKEYLLYY